MHLQQDSLGEVLPVKNNGHSVLQIQALSNLFYDGAILWVVSQTHVLWNILWNSVENSLTLLSKFLRLTSVILE